VGNSNRKRKKQLGQGIVEFALVIPILITIVVGIFEAARAIYIYQAITTASREAARQGSGADSSGATPNYLDCTAIKDTAVRLGGPGGVTNANVTITYDHGPGSASIGSCGFGDRR
jgi:Flp pilus assembly protein TadG